MMKNILLFSMLAVIVAMTSCNKQDDIIIVDDAMSITFSLDKDVPQTRTDGSNRYIIEVYEGADVSGESVKRVVQENNATFTISLEKDKEYVCLFWADDNTNETYDASSLKDVTLNSGKEMSEAFFASKEVSTADTNTYAITLKRAVAKVNLIEKDNVSASTDFKVTFNRYTKFNAFSGEVAGESAPFTKTFNSEATTATLGTLLTFASVGGITTDFSFVYGTEAEKEVTNVALKANFITNISGKFSTEITLTFTITKDEDWSAEEIIVATEMFPDEAFRDAILEKFDTNGDGEISETEALAVQTIYVQHLGITSLKGIEYFTNLRELGCTNNSITALDLSKNTALVDLECYNNDLIRLNVSGCDKLEGLECTNNKLVSLDVSGFTALKKLECRNNQLDSLDITGCIALERLLCYTNQLTALDVSGFTALVKFECFDNQLTSINLSDCSALEWLSCHGNQLITLDVSASIVLTELRCRPMDTTLETVFLKRGTNTFSWDLLNSTELIYKD